MKIMKRMLSLTLAMLLVLGQVPFGALAADTQDAAAVQTKIDSLPGVDMVRILSIEEQGVIYNGVYLDADNAYHALTEEQKAQVDASRLMALANYFNTLVMPLEDLDAEDEPVVEYGLTIGDSAVTNKNNQGTGWVYSDAEKTLTLSGGFAGAIEADVDVLTILVNGVVDSKADIVTNGSVLVIKGTSGNDQLTVAAVTAGDSNTADVTVENLTMNIEAENANALYTGVQTDAENKPVYGSLTVKDAVLHAKNTGDSSYAAVSTGKLTVTGMSVVKAETEKGTHSISAAEGCTFSDSCHILAINPKENGFAIQLTNPVWPELYRWRNTADGDFADTEVPATAKNYFAFIGAQHLEYTQNGEQTEHSLACNSKCPCPVTLVENETCAGGTASCTAKAVCATCGNGYGETLDHVEKTAATCQSKAVCGVCGFEYGETKDHTLQYTADDSTDTITATCTDVCEGTGSVTLTAAGGIYNASAYPASYGTPTGLLAGKTFAIRYINKADNTESDTAPINAGEYTATICPAENVSVAVDYAITSADLSGAQVSVSSQSYTGAALTPEVTVQLSGKTLIPGTDFTVAYSDNTAPGTATYTVTGKGNYKGTKEGTFTIQARTLSAEDFTVTLPTGEKLVYDGTVKEAVVETKEDLKNLDQITVKYYQGTELLTGAPVKAGTYTVKLDVVTEDENYSALTDITNYNWSFTITKRPLTIQANDQTVLLGAVVDQSKFTAEGLAEGDSVKELTLESTSTNVETSSGSISPKLGTLSIENAAGEDVTASYQVEVAAGKLTVIKHAHDWAFTAEKNVITASCEAEGCTVEDGEVILTLVAPAALTYDGEAKTVTLTQSPQVDNKDVFPDLLIKVTYEPEAGGSLNDNKKPVNAGTYTASLKMGAGEGEVEATLEFEIEPKTIEVEVQKASGETITKTYDGTTAAELSLVVKGGYDFTATGTAAYEDDNAGENKKITITDIVLTGEGASNYTVEDIETTGIITKKDVTFTAADAYKYLGETDPGLKGTYSRGGIIDADKSKVSGKFGREAGEEAGVYDLTLGTVAIAGEEENYNISFNGGKFIIYPYSTEVGALNKDNVSDSDKETLEEAQTALEEFQAEWGLTDEEIEDEATRIAEALEAIENGTAGDNDGSTNGYKITSGNNANWTKGSSSNLTFKTNASTALKEVHVKGSSDSNWKKLTKDNHYTTSDSDKTITLKADYLKTKSTGTYSIKLVYEGGQVTGQFTLVDAPSSGENEYEDIYEITEGSGTVWDKSSVSGLSFTANIQNYTNTQGNTEKHYPIVKVKDSGSNSWLTLTWNIHYTAVDGSSVVTLKVGYLRSKNVGTYDIRLDYGTGTATGTFEIIESLIPSVEDFDFAAPENLIYDGTEKEATITAGEGIGTITKIYYQDNVPIEGKPVNVGTYTVKINVAKGEDYSTASGVTSDDWVFTITQRELEIVADEQTVGVGGELDQTAYSINGTLADGDTVQSVTLSGNTSVAMYQGEIMPSAAVIKNSAGKDVTTNYDLSYVAGELKVVGHNHTWAYAQGDEDHIIVATCNASHCPVTDSRVTITLQAEEDLTYDGEAKMVTVVQSSENEIFTDMEVTYGPSGNLDNGAAINAGTYTASLKMGAGEGEVEATLEFEIEPKTIEVEVQKASGETISKIYDGTTAAELSLVVKGGYDFTATGTAAYEDDNAGENKKITITDIVLTGEGASNYTVEDIETTGTITKKDVTFTAADAYKYLGETDPGLKGTYSRGGIIDADKSKVSGKFGREAGEEAGVYDLTLGTVTIAGEEENYNISFNGGKFIIYPYAREIGEMTSDEVTTADQKNIKTAKEALEEMISDYEEDGGEEDVIETLEEELTRLETLLKYQITSGDGASWKKNTSTGLVFKINDVSKLSEVHIKPETDTEYMRMKEANYTVSSDNKTITLKPDYLKKKTAGNYSIRFKFSDGSINGSFILLAADGSITEDDNAGTSNNGTSNNGTSDNGTNGYKITSGNNANWTKGSSANLAFTTNATSALKEVHVKGPSDSNWKKLTKDNHFTVSNNDKTVTLKAAYLKTKSNGTYSIKLVYEAGQVTGAFKIAAKGASPNTGDASRIELWTATMAASALAMTSLFLANRRKRFGK